MMPWPSSTIPLASRLVDGLEPVFVRGREHAVYWQQPFGWFRWFASGDAALLMVLLLIKEIS